MEAGRAVLTVKGEWLWRRLQIRRVAAGSGSQSGQKGIGGRRGKRRRSASLGRSCTEARDEGGGGALGRHFSQATHSHWQIRRGVGGSGRRAGAQMGDDDAYCGSGMGGEAVGSGGDGCSALRWQEREKERWKEEAGADKWSRLGN
jgi:hypothetical protein